MPLRPPLLLAMLALVAASCGEAGSGPTAGPSLVHLDPRAEDGRSASEVLAAAEIAVLDWLDLTTSEGRAPWIWSGPDPRIAPGPEGAPALVLPAGPTAQGPAALRLALTDAPAVDTLRVTATFPGGCTAGLRLTLADGTVEQRHVEVPFDPSRTVWDLDLGHRAAGELVTLELAPSVGADARELPVTRLALVRKGLPSPAAPPVTGDHGLVELGGLLRRVWPGGGVSGLHVTVPPGPATRLRVEAWPGPAAAPGQVAKVLERITTEDGRDGVRLRDSRTLTAPTRFDLELPVREQPVRLELASPDPADPTAAHAASVLWTQPRLVAPRHAATPPNIVLVTLDTTRADVAADPAVAPNLAALAAEGLAFPNAWSPSNTTTPAHASMLTGLAPHRHGAVAVGRVLRPADGSTLAERLRAAGYRTAAAVSVEHLDAAHGFARGFDRFLDPAPGANRDGRQALAFALEALGEAREGGEPLFLWLHWFDPHTPYLPPEDADAPGLLPADRADLADAAPIPVGVRDRPRLAWLPADEGLPELVGRYRAGVAFTDALLGELVDGLRATGLWEDTVLAVTADHGEALGEADLHASHASLYAPVTRVPLVLRLPWDEPLSTEDLAAPVSSMDLFTTLLEVAGEAPGDGLDARSLLHPDPDRRLWLEADRLSQIGLVAGPDLYVGTLRRVSLGFAEDRVWSEPGDVELYRWEAWRAGGLGPERLAEADPARTAELRAAWQAYVEGLGDAGLDALLSADERATLEALGYLGDEE